MKKLIEFCNYSTELIKPVAEQTTPAPKQDTPKVRAYVPGGMRGIIL